MKARWLAGVLLLASLLGAWWIKSRPSGPERGLSSPRESSSINETPVEAAATTSSQAPESASTPEPVEPSEPAALPTTPPPKPVALAATEEPPIGPELGEADSGLTPVTVLENMRAAFRQYSLRFGGNPVGNNSEITAALNGQNPRQVVFLTPEDGARFNVRGEMVDHWNTPYFFHQLSRTQMEIRSGGPDRRMWTADDLVMK